MRFSLCLLALFPVSFYCSAQAEHNSTQLKRGWQLQSSCKLRAGTEGGVISTGRFSPQGWIATDVPHTVEGAQVDAHVFPFDPFVGTNLRKIPGTNYPLHKIFAYLPMPEDSPYRCSWWYRTEFRTPVAKKRVWLKFNGINYRANIWLNGKKIADQADIAGAFRSYELDVTNSVARNGANVLAVETFAQKETDLGISYLDWAPAPADKTMGLWRDVQIETSGSVHVRYPSVTTHFADAALNAADLSVVADVINATDTPQAGTATAQIGAQQVHQVIALQPHEAKSVHFDPIRVKSPKAWWPFSMGGQPLETVTVSFVQHGAASDSRSARFGIREIKAAINDAGGLQFNVNGRDLLIRGAGWAPDMFSREPRERLAKELAYVRDMGLNTVRLEGKMGSDEFFDLADQMGILVMAGWMCCDYWEKWPSWTPEHFKVAHESQYSQISRLRHHPSMLVWLNGSDNPPPADIEKDYIAVLKERDWPNPFLSSASGQKTTVTGASGVKMSGPYDYVPPEYWYLDKSKYGGAWAFNTETSPGAAVPIAAEVKRVIPQAELWPMNDTWNYHAGEGKFAQYTNYVAGMTSIYGAPTSLDDFTAKSQLTAYEGERAMFEAYGRRKYGSTGVIQWMLNNAWPAFIWHLYDYYLVPGAGYFGTKKATEPLHAQYAYDDRDVAVVNSTHSAQQALRVSVRLLDLTGKELWRKDQQLDVGPDAVADVFGVPQPDSYDGTQLIQLRLSDAAGKSVSQSLYWVPKKVSDLNWSKTDAFITPANQYSNMQDLATMPKAQVSVNQRMVSGANGDTVMHVELRNTGTVPALLVHARAVKRGTDLEIVPVFWNDNYVSLMPGESQTLTARFKATDAAGGAQLKLEGWNLK